MKKYISSIKIVAIIVIIIFALCLSACDNRSYDTKYTYNKAHIRVNDVWFDVDIVAWREFAHEQLVLVINDGTEMIIHSRDCILYNGTLPTAR